MSISEDFRVRDEITSNTQFKSKEQNKEEYSILKDMMFWKRPKKRAIDPNFANNLVNAISDERKKYVNIRVVDDAVRCQLFNKNANRTDTEHVTFIGLDIDGAKVIRIEIEMLGNTVQLDNFGNNDMGDLRTILDILYFMRIEFYKSLGMDPDRI